MNARAFLFAALIAGCGPAITRAAAPEPFSWAERVRGWDACLDRFHCPNWRVFAHADDPQVGQIWWLISTSGHACEIPADAGYRLGELFTCRWRTPRG